MPLAPGARFGPYDVVSELAAGGMGEVYKAHDRRLDRFVALKVLPQHVAATPDLQHRFEREAKALAALSHPHICAVYDIGTQDGVAFLVMEYLEGQTIAERLECGAMPVDEVLPIAVALTDALDAAHGKGIIHRDLKPGNIMVTANGVKLLDFGLAKRDVGTPSLAPTDETKLASSHKTSPGLLLGTVSYMAPEQARGEEVDTRADLFSLGAVLHEMASGIRAFPGPTAAVVFEALLDKPPVGADRLPSALSPIVSRAVEKSRELRYQTAADLRADLLRALRGEPSASAPPTKPPRRTGGARTKVKSIAVLRFSSTGTDADTEYLGEGVPEGLINSLSRMGRLRVAPAMRSFRFASDTLDLREAALALSVDALLTGRLVVRRNTLVVKVSLIDPVQDAQLWGAQFTAQLADIFTLQDDLVAQVLQALKVQLSGRRQPSATRRQPPKQRPNTDVYHLYLKGRFYAAKRTPPNTHRALECYQQALDIDPTFAPAYAGVADCYAHLGFTPYSTMPPSEAYPKAKVAARKALALDPSLGEAHASLGLCALFYDWDWRAAAEEFEQCLQQAPDAMGSRVWHAAVFSVQRRHDEAIAKAREAVEVDPLSANALTLLAQMYYMARRFDEAEHTVRQALDLDRDYVTAVLVVALIHQARGAFADAARQMEHAVALAPHPHVLSVAGLMYGLAGRQQDAEAIAARLDTLASEMYVSPYSRALASAGLGRADDWQKAMAASLEERSGLLIFLDSGWCDPMRDHPFHATLRRAVGLPEIL